MTRARTATKFTGIEAAPKAAEEPAAYRCHRRNIMRLRPFVSTVFVLALAAPLIAQEWVEFASRDDRFTCLFPTQPKVTTTTYLSQHEAELPARIYTAEQGRSK